MVRKAVIAASAVAPLALAQSSANETVLGIYIFHRHGDRTAKILGHTALTDLGYSEVYSSGEYYRNRYISSNASYPVLGVSNDLVNYQQITATAPASDVVLQNSATGFLQGLYPPVGSSLGTQTLGNGTNVTAPMSGYQLIPVNTISTGAGSENSAWLQDATACNNAEISSNEYFSTPEYTSLLQSTNDFYQSILPVINATYNSTTDTFKNAYAIWDLIHVSEIHNKTINSSDLLTDETLFQLQTLANTHEWNLAYNASSEIRAVAGMQLASQIMQFFNTTVEKSGKPNIGIQFGSYGTFASFFGLAGLQNVNVDFTGVTDYASSMVFELYTPGSVTAFPTSEDDLFIRFLYHNGTASASSPPAVYPLFGSTAEQMSWADFTTGMNRFSINSQEQWCDVCGNTTGVCAPFQTSATGSGSDSSSSSSSHHGGNGLSPAVNGVIGAFVTLAVILLLEAAILLLGGLRLVSKKRLAQPNHGVAEPKASP